MLFIKTYNSPFNLKLIKTDNLGKSGVYLILNSVTQDFYIGSAVSKTEKHNRIYFRFRDHFLNKKITNNHLKKAFLKYGQHNFSFNILTYNEAEKIAELEINYINKFKPAYNILKPILEDWQAYTNYHESKRNDQIKWLNLDKQLKTRSLMSERAKLNHTMKKYDLTNFKNSGNKKTSVYDLNNQHLNDFISAKKAALHYKIDYRNCRKHLKSGKPLKKQGVIIKYSL